MKFGQVYYCVVLLFVGSHTFPSDKISFGQNDAVSNQTAAAYNIGVRMGIINPEKYPLESFEADERNIFKDLFQEYLSLDGVESINYQEWLIMNNFGLLPDTQESLFEIKISDRSTADNKRDFMNTVKKGDILVTGHGPKGLIGHAAIMTTDNWVLEMPGGGTKDNNRQVYKDKWFDIHASDWTTVYRCPDSSVAHQAAVWADHTYYNPTGGSKKTIHIDYKITPNWQSINPSYCSKLVIQAYYFGTGSKQVIKNPSTVAPVIIPTLIPGYFMSPYHLVNKGRF